MKPADVPAGPLIVDTDVFSWLAWQRGRHAEFGRLVEGHVLALSFAGVAELRSGALRGAWGQPRREVLEERIRSFVVLPATDSVTRWWADLDEKLHDRLQRGGANDMWTTACALSQSPQLPIVTGNLRDFQKIHDAFPQLTLIHPDL